MRKAIVHRNPLEPLYIEISECEEDEVEKIKKELERFGDIIMFVMNAVDVPKLQLYVKSYGGGPGRKM